jgi:hypothetical protein
MKLMAIWMAVANLRHNDPVSDAGLDQRPRFDSSGKLQSQTFSRDIHDPARHHYGGPVQHADRNRSVDRNPHFATTVRQRLTAVLAIWRCDSPELVPASFAFEKVGLNEGGFVRRKALPSVLLQVVIVRVQGTLPYPCGSDGKSRLAFRSGEGGSFSWDIHTAGSLSSMADKAAISEVRKG